jgi:hypothetical protein
MENNYQLYRSSQQFQIYNSYTQHTLVAVDNKKP